MSKIAKKNCGLADPGFICVAHLYMGWARPRLIEANRRIWH